MADLLPPHFSTQSQRMPFHRIANHILAAGAVVALFACTDTTAPDQEERAASDLRLLTAPYGTPQLATTQVTFYAVKGRAAEADIWYRAKAGRTDSTKFLEFHVGAGSLANRPDGSAMAPGDSVLITLTVTDQSHFLIDFQPSGLRFSAGDQPTLKISFAACGDDLNYDGVVDSQDASMQASLSIWRQEAPFQPWHRVSSTLLAPVKEVNAQLGGFTGYALMF